MSPIDLRLGRWQDVLADVTTCDAVICDPPYSARTHEAYREMDEVNRSAIEYRAWSDLDVSAFVSAWAPRVTGWMCSLTDHMLIPAWQAAYEAAGLYSFAPLACVESGSRVRLSGDGPSQWSVFLMVARPRTREMQRWGALVGAYVTPQAHSRRGQHENNGIMGTKPVHLMRAIIRDYSRPGDLVVDPFCGSGTTALAAAMEGRRCITSEEKPEHYKIARKRLDRGYQPGLI